MVPYALSRRRSTTRSATASVLVTTLLLTGCTPPATVQSRRRPAGPAAEHVLAGSLHGRTGAYLLLRDAASRVEVRLADLPGLLYRVSTPADSGLAPWVTGTPGRVRIVLRPTGADGPDSVTILLNRAVRWDLRLPAGAGEQRLDLSGGRVTRIDLGASGLVDLRLPDPTGTVPVTFTGGVGSVAMAGPPAVPMRIHLREGAGAVVTPWTANNGTPAGAVLLSPGWPTAPDRYAVHARGGLGTLTVR
jgi:hypothetical protein